MNVKRRRQAYQRGVAFIECSMVDEGLGDIWSGVRIPVAVETGNFQLIYCLSRQLRLSPRGSQLLHDICP
jgi:hypothetical protein